MRIRSLLLAFGVLLGALLAPTPASATPPVRYAFAYVDAPAAPAWVNLSAAHRWPVGVQGMKIGPGRYQIKFPGVGYGSRGVAHVTAVDYGARNCQLVGWTQTSTGDEIVTTQCWQVAGGVISPADTRHTVVWTVGSGVLAAGQPGHAYVHYRPGVGIVDQYNSLGLVNGVAGANPYTVTFPAVGDPAGAVLAGDVQVTAIDPLYHRRCKLGSFTHSGTNITAVVLCFDGANGLPPTEFAVSYHRRQSVYGAFAPPTRMGYLWCLPGGGTVPGQTNWNSVVGVGGNSCAALAPGFYQSSWPQIGPPQTNAHVTAISTQPNFCNLKLLWSANAAFDVTGHQGCWTSPGGVAVNEPHLMTFTSRV
ncbi:hypothetical protein AB0M43_07175 [Longispora sp. NPDC051575]|uniref:hypothetical protein n=1 Tax=Longispora sp. NPDC051575 TaxID=3154943 RepID=UPI0034460212